MKPKENYFITIDEKEKIKKDIIQNRSIMTVTPEIVDPDYTYLVSRLRVEYNPNITPFSSNELSTLIRSAVVDYRNTYLNSFEASFRNSMLERLVYNVDKSVISSANDPYFQKRVVLNTTNNITTNYSIDFKGPLKKSSSLYTFATIQTPDVTGVSRNVYFEETPQSYTGLDSITIVTQGDYYTSAPDIVITGDGVGATAIAKIVNGKLASIEVTNRGINYTSATINILGGGGAGAIGKAVLESRVGTLRTYYYADNGEKVIVNADAGTINYDTGKITLKNLIVTGVTENNQYDENILTINIQPLYDSIKPPKNNIFDIDFNDPGAIILDIITTDESV